MTQKYNVAVAGATGAVGTEIVQILEQRDFPIENLFLLASSKSKGKKVEFNSMIDALNFMTTNGYVFEQAYTVTIGQSNVYHFLMSKK